MKNKSIQKIIALVIVAIVVALPPVWSAVKSAATMLASLDVEQVKAYILSFGVWAPSKC